MTGVLDRDSSGDGETEAEDDRVRGRVSETRSVKRTIRSLPRPITPQSCEDELT